MLSLDYETDGFPTPILPNGQRRLTVTWDDVLWATSVGAYFSAVAREAGNSLVEIDWLGYTALAVANGVSATDITLIFDHEHDFDIGQRGTIPTDSALGGCSGAPLLTFVEQRRVCSWRLGDHLRVQQSDLEGGARGLSKP
jgi:hypothetical protein